LRITRRRKEDRTSARGDGLAPGNAENVHRTGTENVVSHKRGGEDSGGISKTREESHRQTKANKLPSWWERTSFFKKTKKNRHGKNELDPAEIQGTYLAILGGLQRLTSRKRKLANPQRDCRRPKEQLVLERSTGGKSDYPEGLTREDAVVS